MFRERLRDFSFICKTLLAPKRCVQCGKRGTFLCISCRRGLFVPKDRCLFCRRHSGIGVCRTCTRRTHIERISWTARYRHPAARMLIHLLKYRGARDIAAEIATLMEIDWRAPSHAATLVPIPLHPRRCRARGFNQSMEIANHLAARTHSNVVPILARVRHGAPLAHCTDRSMRIALMRGAFVLTRAAPEHIILIDDVATTGTTLREAARVLYRGGAKRIEVMVFAHD